MESGMKGSKFIEIPLCRDGRYLAAAVKHNRQPDKLRSGR